MYKHTAILLLVILTVCLSTGCGDRSNPEDNYPPYIKHPAAPIEDTTTNEATGFADKQAATYIDLFSCGVYYIKTRIKMDYYGLIIETITETYANGNERAVITKIGYVESAEKPVEGIEKESIAIYKDNKIFTLDSESRTYTVADSSTQSDGLFPNSGYIFRGSGEAELFGVSYSFEEYYTDSGEIRFYFDNNKLVGLDTLQGNRVQKEVMEISSVVPPSIFDVPAEYTEVEAK